MADLIIVIAELLIVSSYIFINTIILRIVAAIGMIFYVIAGFVAGYQQEGMRALIVFSGLAAVINIAQVIRIMLDKYSVFIPEKLRMIREKNFALMSNSEFVKFCKLAHERKYKKSEIIVHENESVKLLWLLIEGSAEVNKGSLHMAVLPPGNFVGEMSYISNTPTVALVRANSEHSTCLVWEYAHLEKLKTKKPDLYGKFFNALAVNAVEKLKVAGRSISPLVEEWK